MSSFVNLMADDVWSDGDIINRTEAIIASEFPPAQHAILQRKVQGQAMGVYTLTEAEQAQLQRYSMVSHMAGLEADAARADMALLAQALAVEAAQRRLALEPVQDNATDALEREQAQAVVDAATAETQQLVAQRAAARAPMEPGSQELPQ